jgi:hypothetical protein
MTPGIKEQPAIWQFAGKSKSTIQVRFAVHKKFHRMNTGDTDLQIQNGPTELF